MALFILFWLGLCNLVLTQTSCRPYTPPSSGRVVLTYTPYVTPQTPPLSTIYERIVTAWTYAVDCRYVSIEQIDGNYMISGAFSGTPTTVDALTITRIGCIQQSSAITRRDVPLQTDSPVNYIGQDVSVAPELHKRAALRKNLLLVATRQASEIPPDTQDVSVRAYRYMVQVNTALYALNLYNTGFNMSVTCTLLNDPTTQARLIQASVDPAQAAAIICYAAQYGLFFDMSNAQLLSDLLGILYSIEVKSGFTTNTTVICDSLNLDHAGLLGVDTKGVQSYICGSPATSVPSASILLSTSTSVGTFGTVGTVGTGAASITVAGTSPPFANASSTGTTTNFPLATAATVTWINGTGTWANDSYAEPTHIAVSFGSIGPTAISETLNVVFPNATVAGNTSDTNATRVPPSPTLQQNYPQWTTSITRKVRILRY